MWTTLDFVAFICVLLPAVASTVTPSDAFARTSDGFQIGEKVDVSTLQPFLTSTAGTGDEGISGPTTAAVRPDSTTVGTDTETTTTKKPETCMKARAANFSACFEALGNNAMTYIPTMNLTGFLEDICDPKRSKPYMTCIKEHFTSCPEFQDRPEVQFLKFGPYHIKDIIFFRTIDQMCDCAPGLVCIQQLIKTRSETNLTIDEPDSSWGRLPNTTAICQYDTTRYIGCVRKNLRRCQSPLTVRYGNDFTNEDAENIRRMYDFTRQHCGTVNATDFETKYKCIETESRSKEVRTCMKQSESSGTHKRICQIRDCVKDHIEPRCDKRLVDIFIDGLNIYRHDIPKILFNPCSGVEEVGLSIVVIALTLVIVIIL